MSIISNDVLVCGILIIDDDYLSRVVLREIFKKQGFTRIDEAHNGRDGLNKIQSFRPDLVILDVLMPEMDGIECCKSIRRNADPQIAGVPVLFQTALTSLSDKARLFEVGATDYLTKPIDPHEITARAVVHLEREVMTRHLKEFKTRLAHELDTARLTQQVLIPNDKTIAEVEKGFGLQICSHYQPSSELGGDFWGFKALSKETLAIYMVDFSGHGVNAALNVFRLHALMQATMNSSYAPGAYLSHLNSILTPLLPIGQFATMFYGIINCAQNTLSYASAAAPAAILFKGREGCKILNPDGKLLGATKGVEYATWELPFNVDDCLMLYSDALVETNDDAGKLLSEETVAEIFQAALHTADTQPHTAAFSAVLNHFNAHFATRLSDDLTLVACHRPR